MDNEQKIISFLKIVKESKRLVFFGGAGVSTESGVPDFRSVDGLYNQQYDYPPETILSHSFFCNHTEEFFRFYRDKMLYLDAVPNITHIKLAELEKKGILSAVVTQNIDGLHEAAGSQNVYNLHGSVFKNTCTKCGKKYGIQAITNSKGVPHCSSCGGVIKPDVVLYEESLDDSVLTGAINAIKAADTLVVGGTSLAVYPAAGLVNYFGGKNLVLINLQPTQYDNYADLCIAAKLGDVFKSICD